MVHYTDRGPGELDRREFLRRTARTGAGLAFAPSWMGRAAESLANPLAYATISWPDNEFSTALETISALSFQGVQMLGWVCDAYRGARVAELRRQLTELKLQAVALSCHNIRLDPARLEDETDKLRADAEFFQKLGGLYLQVTDRGEPNRRYPDEVFQLLGARLNQLGDVARDFGLQLAYHPHDRTIGQTREGLGRVLDATDPTRVKLLADVAHLALGGSDPAEVIRTYHQRLIATHFKDVRREVLDLARRDHDLVRSAKYRFCEIGQGGVNFKAIIEAFRDTQFQGWVICELDAYEPRTGGAATSAQMNRDAARKLGFRI